MRPMATVLIFFFGLTEPTFADSWVADPITGCKIWNDEDDSSTATVIWSGGCTDGLASGDGLLTWVKAGELVGRYVGDMNAGKLHGQGILDVIAEGGDGFNHLEAQFADGLANGVGVFFGADGAHFEGEFENGVRHGYGRLTDAAGNTYEGNFSEGSPDGFGRSELASGDEYIGFFVSGLHDGEGLQINADGEVYAGEFDDGLAVGFGRYEDAEGGVYVGLFAAGVPSGPGTYVAANGTIYQGNFSDRQPDGQILVTKPSGEQVLENWKNGSKVE